MDGVPYFRIHLYNLMRHGLVSRFGTSIGGGRFLNRLGTSVSCPVYSYTAGLG